jgi:hypothetical protein
VGRRIAVLPLLALVLVLALVTAVPAAADGPGGPTWDKATWISCTSFDAPGGNWITTNSIAKGEEQWFAWFPVTYGVDTGVAIWSNEMLPTPPGGTGVHFHVWAFLNQPWGLTLTEIGQSTTFGKNWAGAQKTWRGGANLYKTHYFQVKNLTENTATYTLQLNCANPEKAGNF